MSAPPSSPPPPSPPGEGTVGARIAMLRRLTPGPLLVRLALFVVGMFGLLIAWPVAVWGQGFVLVAFLLLALLPAALPRGPATTTYLLTTVAGWLVSTSYFGLPPDFLGLVLLATALYLVHTLAALAAVLPYDAVVAPAVLLRWVGRSVRVLALTVALALFLVVVPGYLGGRGYLLGSLLGLALVVATLAYLARLVRRR